MTLKTQVTSLEPSKKLKDLGVKQESIFVWVVDNDAEFLQFLANNGRLEWYRQNNHTITSAFTVAELGELLRPHLKKSIWLPEIRSAMSDATYMLDEANARAKMLIYLLENHLIENPELLPAPVE